ncbi:hypothetical protein EV361DRAFT_880007 [Lentinula raphanica]|uniref:Methyltransferase-domain-containing protein n=1 Tax=Lentinula raphanica TaxID=153919 RepID=A0AA38UHH6_9AGAR|nr:hypothetical protein C8R42DRAFT_659916 [Lentinula raphanica]KAJ3758468.1 hypothetical protein EV360DRAFT_43853 [Lentinula raphanica]KAJ3827267.1 hypothetical protein F5880DRAFT_1538878 [Lentinula raphanica]KAJ3838457.1 hypothetical protein F5878DRAFT_562411 [Lentinula raphanica]KAJ3977142.1 hypothetical protein EV361DRAFT_880007 [Lentinula raphanica]
MQPAHQTKHQSILEISFLPELTFHLSQKNQSENNSSTGTTGTTLWLGAQCLSAYIAQYHKPPQNQQTTTAIELGSGVGLSSLVLSALGYSTVFATDTELVINSVLSRNVESNLSVIAAGRAILVRELDWHVPPGHWNWDNPRAIASRTMQSTGGKNDLPTPFDLIITSDTVYEESLVEPLLRTLHALSLQSLAASKLASLSQSLPSESPPLVLLCLERRDPSFIDHVLASARDKWCFSTEQVPKRKLAKVMQRHVGGRRKWDSNRAEWEGVEIWKLQLGSTS